MWLGRVSPERFLSGSTPEAAVARGAMVSMGKAWQATTSHNLTVPSGSHASTRQCRLSFFLARSGGPSTQLEMNLDALAQASQDTDQTIDGEATEIGVTDA